MGRPAVDMKGQRFGRIRVLERVPTEASAQRKRALWRCVCDCGKRLTVIGQSLRRGDTLSCGCFRKEALGRTVAARAAKRRRTASAPHRSQGKLTTPRIPPSPPPWSGVRTAADDLEAITQTWGFDAPPDWIFLVR